MTRSTKLRDAGEQYLTDLDAKRTTTATHHKRLTSWIRFLEERGTTTTDELTAEDVADYRSHVESYLHPVTIRAMMQTIRQFIRYLEAEGLASIDGDLPLPVEVQRS